MALAVLVAIPFRQGQAWSVWFIPLFGLVFYLPSLYATVWVTLDTPAVAPWYANLTVVLVLILGFILCPNAAYVRSQKHVHITDNMWSTREAHRT